MNSQLKAVVIKTPQLKETLTFFTDELGLSIRELSPRHFVVHSKGIRILFVESKDSVEIEFYLSEEVVNQVRVQEDPNRIKVIRCPFCRNHKRSS